MTVREVVLAYIDKRQKRAGELKELIEKQHNCVDQETSRLEGYRNMHLAIVNEIEQLTADLILFCPPPHTPSPTKSEYLD